MERHILENHCIEMFRNRRANRGMAVVLTVALLFTSCTSYSRSVNLTENLYNGLKPGDTVRVTTKTGRTVELKITTIDAEAIVGTEQRIPLSEVATIEKQEISTAKTIGLVALLALIAGIIAVVIAA